MKRDIYIDITLEEIEAHVSKNIGEINSNEAINKDPDIMFNKFRRL